MSTKENSFLEEYQEMLEFVRKLQEDALEKSDLLLSEKKELEYRKRQQEFVIIENEKKRTPNIAMFSPLSVENTTESEIAIQDELDKLSQNLLDADEQWNKQKNICKSFDKLKNFLYDIKSSYQQSLCTENDTSIDYSMKLLETQEMDRNRISRDLHDSTVQSLTSLGHKMEYCSKMLDRDPVKVKLELQSMIELNKEIINDMRAIIYDLRPMSLNNIGLVATVEAYCMHIRRNYNLDISFVAEGEKNNLPSIVTVTLYRIIQEACNNAIRHSQASRIKVSIAFYEQSVEIEIADNGIGFEISTVEKKAKEDYLHGFGLASMKERTRLLSGTFAIDTNPGFGTKVRVTVPLDFTFRKEDLYE